MKRTLVRKRVSDFTAADLYRHWSGLYTEIYQRSFQGFPARDLKLLKQLQEGGWSNAEILCAMKVGLANRDMGVPLFVADIEKWMWYTEPYAEWVWATRYDEPAGVVELMAAWQALQSISPEYRNEVLQQSIEAEITKKLEDRL